MEAILNYESSEEEEVGSPGTTDDVDKLPVAHSASETKEEIPSSETVVVDTEASPIEAETDCVATNKKNEDEDTSNKTNLVTVNANNSPVGAAAANSATDSETPKSNPSLMEKAESNTVIAQDISANHGEVGGDDSSKKSTKVDGTDGNTKEPTPAETSESSDFDFPVNEAS